MSETPLRYVQIQNPEDHKRVSKLVELLRSSGFGFFAITERSQGSNQFVDVMVSVKVSGGPKGKGQEINDKRD